MSAWRNQGGRNWSAPVARRQRFDRRWPASSGAVCPSPASLARSPRRPAAPVLSRRRRRRCRYRVRHSRGRRAAALAQTRNCAGNCCKSMCPEMVPVRLPPPSWTQVLCAPTRFEATMRRKVLCRGNHSTAPRRARPNNARPPGRRTFYSAHARSSDAASRRMALEPGHTAPCGSTDEPWLRIYVPGKKRSPSRPPPCADGDGCDTTAAFSARPIRPLRTVASDSGCPAGSSRAAA